MKPRNGFAVLNRTHPLARQMTHCYLLDNGIGKDLINREQYTASAATLPFRASTKRFGGGIANAATAARFVNLGTTGSWVRNYNSYSIAAVVKVLGLPANATSTCALFESTGTSSSATRLSLRIANNALGTTGINWVLSLRFGDADAILNVSFGSGTRVVVGDEVVLLATVNGTKARLWVNGALEAEGNPGGGSPSDTAPLARFILSGNNADGFNGVVSAVYAWKGVVLNPPNDTPSSAGALVQMLSRDPYGMFLRPRRPAVNFVAPVVVVPPPTAITEVGGGRGRARGGYRIEIDGETFDVETLEDVARLVKSLKQAAEQAAEAQAAADIAKPARKAKKPVIPQIELIRPQFQQPDDTLFLQQVQAQLEAAQEMVRQTYLDIYARVALQQQDDEDIADILLLS